MPGLILLLAGASLALAPVGPAVAGGANDLDVTMEIIEDLDELDENIPEMQGPEDDIAVSGQDAPEDEPGDGMRERDIDALGDDFDSGVIDGDALHDLDDEDDFDEGEEVDSDDFDNPQYDDIDDDESEDDTEDDS